MDALELTALVQRVSRCDPSRIREEVYERTARHEDLSTILPLLSTGLECGWRGARVVFYLLRGGNLVACRGDRTPDLFERAIDGLPILHGSRPAPWWGSRGVYTAFDKDPAWRPFLALAWRHGWVGCWSDRLMTAAGEVVGTLTALVGQAADSLPPDRACLGDATHLAALAIEQDNLLLELKFQAEHDGITDLWNRRSLELRLDQAVASGQPGSLLIAELSGLSRIGHVLGDDVSDAVLCTAASRITSLLGPHDIAGRAGIDDIAVLLPTTGDPGAAIRLADCVASQLGSPFEIEGHELYVNARVGLCRFPEHGSQSRELLLHARTAVARARANSLWRPVAYSGSMQALTPDRFELERRLRHALENEEFRLHYQPQVQLSDDRTVGVEALLRWFQPDLGMVSPAAFIPLAEELGLIYDIGLWVLGEACRQACEWQRAGTPRRMSVNVSAVQIADERLGRHVEEILSASGLDPRLLDLEITESVVLHDFDSALQLLNRLHRLGVTFSLDDFGTGHSALSYLRQLPIERLKIDRSFLGELSGPAQPQLLSSIIRMAHDLGLTVVVEGVETAEQLVVIRDLGGDEIQGYYFCRPLPKADLERWFHNNLGA